MEKDTLRKVQLVQLEIAKEIKRICEENSITYWLEAGTLLGAVRHGGFIPWDDDLDIGMMRSDYERFLRIVPQVLDDRYELVEWRSVGDYPNYFCKIMKKNTVYEEERSRGSSKCGIWVDIFPYDNCPDDQAHKRQMALLTVYRAMLRAKSPWNSWSDNGKFHFKKWLKNMPFRVMSLFVTKSVLISAYERCAMKYNNMLLPRVFTQSVVRFEGFILDTAYFARMIPMKFEDTVFSCPAEFDAYLTGFYGDYMTPPPEDKRGNRHGIVRISFGE